MRKRMTQRASDRPSAWPEPSTQPAPVSDTALTGSRPRLPDAIPQAWLDRLLLATVDLPLSGGEAAVLESMVDCLASILVTHAVGAYLDGARPAGGERFVVRRVPDDVIERPAALNPARLFPGLQHEYVAPVPAGDLGPTLHVASDADPLGAHGSPAVHLLDRAAVVLAHALPKARAASVASSNARRDARMLERRMLQADKLATFGQLAAGIVHELNNPLTSIVAYSEFLVRRTSEGTRALEQDDLERLRRVAESANRMLRFTRELVCYARPSSGSLGPVALGRVIDQAIAFCEHTLSSAGVSVARDSTSEPLTVIGVSEQLVQVFVNLLTNACQAAPPSGGRVHLKTWRIGGPRGRVAIAVEDNGSGIAVENLPHVFVPFFTTRRDADGAGLGLSIIKNIVESHDGTIRVDSAPGRGARFCIELPSSATDMG